MDAKKALLAWMDQFQNDHYVLDVYGESVTVDLPKETVTKLIYISISLVDRVVEAKDELHTAEYEDMEERIRKEYLQKPFIQLLSSACQFDQQGITENH